jgi:Arm DNA-binding domain
MPKRAAGLTVQGIEALKEPGYYADGGGLYLQVTDGGRSWVFRYSRAGKRRDMGLGPLDLVSLAGARDKALTAAPVATRWL